MKNEIGTFEAKAKLSELLRRVQLGQRFTITHRGRPIAELGPCGEDRNGQMVSNAIAAMKNVPRIRSVDPNEIENWIAEGRE